MKWILLAAAIGNYHIPIPLSVHKSESDCIIMQLIELRTDDMDITFACAPLHVLDAELRHYIYEFMIKERKQLPSNE